MDVKEREGFNVAEEGDLLVALDTTLTPALIHEGWPRLHPWRAGRPQGSRPAGRGHDPPGLADRIGTEVAQAIDVHLEDIAAETWPAKPRRLESKPPTTGESGRQ